MPLNENEQKILEEIERRLSEEDPRLVEQVSRTDLHRIASELYRALPGSKRRVRLMGVQAGGLVSAGAQQLAFLRTERWDDVERAVDRIERRFGPGAASPASLLGRNRRR